MEPGKQLTEKDICIRELLFGEDFLRYYAQELKELCASAAFMDAIDKISKNNRSIEFCQDPFFPAFKEFKREISNILFRSKDIYYATPFVNIRNDVIQRGSTALSATISVYYALRYWQLCGGKTSGIKVKAADARKKWPADYRCDDGHYVRSKNESLVDNWLYQHGICHAYEKLVISVSTQREYLCDFYIPSTELYIEIWGMTDEAYEAHKKEKITIYQENGLRLLQLTEEDIRSLDDVLSRVFLH